MAAGQGELAARLRIFRDLQAQEAALVVDELTDIQVALDRDVGDDRRSPEPPLSGEGSSTATLPTPDEPATDPAQVDPAAASPKRARWLAEQARAADEARRPRSRRDLFRPGT